MNDKPVKLEIGSEEWYKAVNEMVKNARPEEDGLMGFYVESICLSHYRESLGGVKAKESTMYKEALRELNKMAVERGYIQNP